MQFEAQAHALLRVADWLLQRERAEVWHTVSAGDGPAVALVAAAPVDGFLNLKIHLIEVRYGGREFRIHRIRSGGQLAHFQTEFAEDDFDFTAGQPFTFWNTLLPDEYDFTANVNPAVSHPRWSQASEEILGTGDRKPTLLFNGYGEQVAGLYKGLEKEALWM